MKNMIVRAINEETKKLAIVGSAALLGGAALGFFAPKLFNKKPEAEQKPTQAKEKAPAPSSK